MQVEHSVPVRSPALSNAGCTSSGTTRRNVNPPARQALTAAVGRLAGAAVFVLSATGASAANNWELGKNQFAAECTSCHNLPGVIGGGKQNFPADASAFAVQSRINDGMRQPNDPFRTNNDNTTNDTISNIVAYLSRTTFPLASLTPGSHNFQQRAVGLGPTFPFTLANNGTSALTFTGASVSDHTNYAVDASACPGSLGAGGSCAIVVTFRPQSAALFNGRVLTVNHSNTFVTSSTATLHGEGIAPFTVSPTSVSFTPASPGTKTVNIVDNKGDRIEVCRIDAATFSFPADFTIGAPYTLGGNGCYTSDTTSSVPRAFPLGVTFTASAQGPRNGVLRIRRVDGSGNALAGTATINVQLQGNPGPFATVNASSLFDAIGDPGVEVDSDNVIDRGFTLFSQGSEALVFDASTFTRSGANAGDYTVLNTGCATLSGLPASNGGVHPSCVLTVRFNPSDAGERRAELDIQMAGTPGNLQVHLRGMGFRGPRLNVTRSGLPVASGDAVQFGTQTIGGLYPSIAVALANGGTLGGLEVVLPAPGSVNGFAFTTEAGCNNLAPAASCTLELRFDPAAVQAYARPFTIRTRAAGSAATYDDFVVNLNGTGSAAAMPVLRWTDTSGSPITRLDFLDTDAGAPRTRHVRLYNAGPGGVNLQVANVIGIDAGNFLLDTTACSSGSNVYELTSCDLVVQFAPGIAGLKTASIQLTANAGTPPSLVVAPLLTTSGTAISSLPPATLALSATALRFGSTSVGSAGSPLELRLANTGTRNLTVSGLAASAPFTVQPRSCASLPFVLPPGGECSLTVGFLPLAEGIQTGTLTITSDASVTSLEVALAGQGAVSPELSSGGCSIASGESNTDPTLWTLVLLAALVLLARRQAGRRTSAIAACRAAGTRPAGSV